MARARNIKPGFFSNDKLAELSPLTRLLFAGLWTIADRAGRLEDRPKKIKAEVLPYDDKANVDKMLDDLQASGFVLRYESRGVRYIQVLSFAKHQNPHKNEAESTIPAPEQHSTSTVQEQVAAPPKDGTTHADSLIPDSLIPDSINTLPPAGGESGFEDFWDIWPKNERKQAKGECLTLWKRRSYAGKADEILSHVEAMKRSEGWTTGYCPAPLVYLRQRRWEGAELSAVGAAATPNWS